VVNIVLQYSFAGLALLLAGLGYARRVHRTALWFGAVCAASTAAAAHYDAFWVLFSFGLLTLWAILVSLPVVDFSWRMRFALVTCVGLLGLVSLWPSLQNMSQGRVPCPHYISNHVGFRLVAGLDLRGGLRLVYTVDVDDAIKDKRDAYYDDMRAELTRVYGIHSGDERPTDAEYAKLRKIVDIDAPRDHTSEIIVKIKNGADPAKLDTRFYDKFRGELTFARSSDMRTVTFHIKDAVENDIRDRAVSQARQIILRRIDELGLREASVSKRDEDVIVEVPGESQKGFARIRDIISQTAKLEFKMVDDDDDFFGPIAKKAKPESLPEGLEFRPEDAPVGLDSNGDVKTHHIMYAFLQLKKDELPTAGLKRFKEWTSTLELPPDRELGYELVYKTNPDTLKQTPWGWRTYLMKSRAEITGDMISDATATPDQSRGGLGGWYVALTFTDQGGRIFERITGDNIKRRFAIILDNRVESAPVIQSRIPGGHASITMGSRDPQVQLEDARKLELVLRSGALPAPISPTNEQRIGPSLGRDSIRLGVEGALGGGLLVLFFMLIYYQRAGVIADVAVIMNLFLQLAILSSFSASMTLPGIAGLALTMGMSVDCNVLINERIREELRQGKSARAAVEVGFSRALTAIIDGHVTTLIAGIILAQYGTGPIKGFAVTLIVGVACSLFTGVVVSRLWFDLWVRGFKTTKLDVG
jgi:preprotein translocase subunit SecD